ncbi:MAG TPA: hypothetical protein VIZ22_01580 [Candidatus Limnocylindrales bacterium]
MKTRWTRWLVRAVALLTLTATAAATVVDALNGWPSGGLNALYGVAAAVFILVGWLVVERASGNPVGLLLLTFGSLFAAYLVIDIFLRLRPEAPQAVAGALFISTLDAPMFIVIALILIVFPDGRLPSPRWRPVVALAVLATVFVVAGTLFDARPLRLFPRYVSPVGIPGVPADALVLLSYIIMATLLALGAIAVVVRWRRGDSVEREQIKWVIAAAIVLLVAEVLNILTFDPAHISAPFVILATVAIALVPLAIGIAILRYRLYEIDRLISRTIGYAIVTGILGATFVVTIVGVQALLASFTQSQTIAVAASTLVAFALFQPLRRRVQRAVDHRFDRRRYDGDRTASAFAERLRDEISVDALATELRTTIAASVKPSAQALWLRRATR